MKRLSFIYIIIAAIMTFSSCEKPQQPEENKPEESLDTYVFGGKEYPVNSISYATDGSTTAIVISPFKDGEDKTVYAVIGINSALNGTTVNIGTSWHNDDYYFIYEDPVRYYSQYRKLNSGTLYIKRTGEHFDISADLILPDGTDFQFDYNGTITSATL